MNWFFAALLAGLLVLEFLPNLKRDDLSPQVKKKEKTQGDLLGQVLSLVAIMGMFIVFLVRVGT